MNLFKSRTNNSIRNMSIGVITQLFNTLVLFISRTVFINLLGAEYLGVHGLFTNILTILSFTELGIGMSITYFLYKPLANADEEHIKSLMHFYKIAYRIIGVVVFFLGICIMPFLNGIIVNAPDISENLYIIYFLFLLNATFSYFFSYKKTIIIADQKNYIISFYQCIFNSLQSVAQVTLLLLLKDFYLYIFVQISTTIALNIFCSYKADQLYPYLKDKKIKTLEKLEISEIFKNVKALFVYKLGSVVLQGTDNIIISAIIGVAAVGIISNYLLILSFIYAMITYLIGGVTASIGNLIAKGERRKEEEIFDVLYFVTFWVYGLFAICLLLLSNKFIVIWIGNSYLLDTKSLFALILHFYVYGLMFAPYTYRTTMGMFIKGRYAPAVAAIINLILSVLLGKIIGLWGILLATTIARVCTSFWLDPYLVYKYKFHKTSLPYFLKFIKYIISVLIAFILSYFIVINISLSGILGFIVSAMVCLCVGNICFFVMYFKTTEFIYLISLLKSYKNKLVRQRVK